MNRAVTWLLRNQWRLVALVALSVALPVVVLGEYTAQDTRDRVRASQIDAGSHSTFTFTLPGARGSVPSPEPDVTRTT